MMEIFCSLGILGIAVICNILCGVYYNINVQDMKFDWIKLINGIIKAIIVAIISVGMAFIFDKMPDLAEAIGVTPMIVMNSAIILYVGKSLTGLVNILGVKIEKK